MGSERLGYGGGTRGLTHWLHAPTISFAFCSTEQKWWANRKRSIVYRACDMTIIFLWFINLRFVAFEQMMENFFVPFLCSGMPGDEEEADNSAPKERAHSIIAQEMEQAADIKAEIVSHVNMKESKTSYVAYEILVTPRLKYSGYNWRVFR